MPSQWLICLGIKPSIITAVGRWCIFFFLIQSFTFVNNNGNWTTGTYQALQTILRVFRNEFPQQFLPLEYLNVYWLTVLFIQYFTYVCYLFNQLQPPRDRDLIYAYSRHIVIPVEWIKYLEELGWHTSLVPDMDLALSREEQGSGSGIWGM